MPRRGSPYGPRYARARTALAGQPCALRLVCSGAPADSADHDPPLALHLHAEGTGCCVLRPACLACQREQGHHVATAARRQQRPLPEPSRAW